MLTRRSLLTLLAAASLSRGAAAGQTLPVVVELFTSQGCTSGPAAEMVLGQLAAEPDVIALGFHVDYWDYIGWNDPFARPEFTARQRRYASLLGRHTVYTPQMVVQGRLEAIGSRGEAVRGAITQIRSGTGRLALGLDAAGGGQVRLPAGEAPAGGAAVCRVLYRTRVETEVTSGENTGRRLIENNVVRSLATLGRWDGTPATLPLGLDAETALDYDGCAVLLQNESSGAILGAAKMQPAV